MEKLKKSVGLRARKARERLGYKNRETFAELLGVHSNTVGFLERGETWISPELIVAYRDRANIDPASILTDQEKIQITGEDIASVLRDALKDPGFYAAFVQALNGFLSAKRQSDTSPR